MSRVKLISSLKVATLRRGKMPRGVAETRVAVGSRTLKTTSARTRITIPMISRRRRIAPQAHNAQRRRRDRFFCSSGFPAAPPASALDRTSPFSVIFARTEREREKGRKIMGMRRYRTGMKVSVRRERIMRQNLQLKRVCRRRVSRIK